MKILEIKNNKLTQQQLDAILTPEVQNMGFLFKKHGFDLRVVGGAVRDLMLGRKAKDIDFATDALPDEMLKFLDAEGVRTIPSLWDRPMANAWEHGTVMVFDPKTDEQYEITTLRIDVETTGRHATVEFTRDWKKDALRRDLTFNAMSIDMEGNLYDYFGGAQDLRDYVTRFVGDADQRIKEDYLRILRFFRFVGRMDKPSIIVGTAQGESIKRNVEGLLQISGERIWMEMSKILTGKHISSIVKQMCVLGVAEQINLPCEQFASIDAVRNKTDNPITILSALINNESAAQTIIFQWKLSNVEKQLLLFLVSHVKVITEWNAKNMLTDGIPLEYIQELCAKHNRMNVCNALKNWKLPVFPVTGQDLIALGMQPGPQFGKILNDLIDKWKASNFTLDKDQLLSYIQ